MGVIVSSLTRRINRFNIENRAHREIGKEKPTPAPTYPSTAKEIERLMKENPEILKEHSQKDAELDKRLKEVYLTSHDEKIGSPKASGSTRNLPLNRSAVKDTDFGFQEPDVIPKGRVSLRQALKFISDHQSDPDSRTISSIAAEYNLSVDITENIVKYFKTFELYMPDKNKVHLSDGETVVTQIESGQPLKEGK